MRVRFVAAKAIGATLTWGLRTVMHRDGATMPGKYALKADPRLLADLAPRLREGSILVVGTNGKTSVTNLLADCLERAGKTVACNRTGANLSWGVASTLLQTKQADWGVFETDELWIARVLPHLASDYVVLLNLFPDQIDRFGDISHVQDSLIETFASSPHTTLIYNADDPFCEAIAQKIPNATIPFGMSEAIDGTSSLRGERELDQTCPRCGSTLNYRVRQYSQLGDYRCPNCGLGRASLAYGAENVNVCADGMSFDVMRYGRSGECDGCDMHDEHGKHDGHGEAKTRSTERLLSVRSELPAPYLAYNLLATCVAATLAGATPQNIHQAIECFDPKNGRLQRFEVESHHVLLNLAKNPAGFNQNIRIICRDESPKIVVFLVNNKEGDGRDPSWIEDVDFEAMAAQGNAEAFVGGMCSSNLQGRLARAGIQAHQTEGVAATLNYIAAARDDLATANVYVIANYTALPPVRKELNELSGTR